ncbi:GNAT family N-acetyltransferase [Streptococcus gallinaceus]|uniref:N-acetylglutamate synthase-like GNAT family acetyltransferase n=1 Tax=Streptococcus gallinaceus TaxID=165758 RepID=A0ABV2JIK1_9STRE|nr:GNAT family N-acetyltransferase [Streptococcus gallinaceus]MCP1638651.1 N-acetylglutamate synthase-like GNAT family acetyltransferase [Streptococcus gallinaceus]MCP1769262.1 N-acetylglutamate synthase-like GNAT family acetyltransferase [Streptococcus gallinaceus]
MVKTIGIRKAYEAEFSQIVAEMQQYLAGKGFSESDPNTYMEAFFHLPKEADENFTVILLNNELAGCMQLSDMNDATVKIENFFIFNRVQGQGLEKFYLEFAVDEAKELGKNILLLELPSQDSQLVQLAASMGFEKEADRESNRAVIEWVKRV